MGSQVELSTVTESAERYMKRIEHLEKQLKEADEEKERLKQKIHANLVRAEGAESLNHGHEKTVADWEEKAAVAERHDQNHSALTVKMAHKLYEAKGAREAPRVREVPKGREAHEVQKERGAAEKET